MPADHAADDRAAIELLVSAFFALFSNRGGVSPDLDRIFELFVAGGSIANCARGEPEVTTLREFVEPRRVLLSNGTLTEFAEVETSARTEIFGRVARRVSTYEKSGCRDGASFTQRGLKVFQFVRTGAGWKIFSVAWDDEREGFPLPALQ